MFIVAILRQWIEVLAGIVFAAREAWRAKRSLIVSREQEHFTIREAGSNSSAPLLASVEPGAQIPAEVVRMTQRALVILELPPEKFVTRTISVPAQAQEFLAGVVRNQIERLSPWQFDQTVFGFDTKAHDEDAAALDVRVLMTTRNAVEDARDQLKAIGLPVDRVVAREHGEQDTGRPVLMWSRASDIAVDELQRTSRLIGAAVAASIAVSVGLSLWAIVSASSMAAESENLAARISVLHRKVQATSSVTPSPSLDPRERAWIAKETSPSASILLEALSDALPNSAYVTELHLEKAVLRLTGLATDPPSLIAPLERSGHLAEVHFFAPATRGPGGKRFRFYIEAKIKRQPDIANLQP